MSIRGVVPDALHEPGYVYQSAVVEQIMADPVEHVPRLLAYLDALLDAPDRWLDTDEQDVSLFYVLYILSTLRVPEAYDRFVRLLRVPFDDLYAILGDELTEAYHIHPARTAGNLVPLMALVADPKVHKLPTRTAALALVRIAVLEPVHEDAVVACLLEHLVMPDSEDLTNQGLYELDDFFVLLRPEHWGWVVSLYARGVIQEADYPASAFQADITAAQEDPGARQERADERQRLREEVEGSTVAEGMSFLGYWDPT